jgi:hypothetical protein
MQHPVHDLRSQICPEATEHLGERRVTCADIAEVHTATNGGEAPPGPRPSACLLDQPRLPYPRVTAEKYELALVEGRFGDLLEPA